jgi:2,4-dienoyl-CoA reductase-like NADH-dependent reductase (Old Yellow Enzyme family)
MTYWKTATSFAQSSKKAMNRLVLAPMTNTQSHLDGTISEIEINWLTSRAQAGFGVILTAATYVEENGRVWKGAPGARTLDHQASIEKLSQKIHLHSSLLIVQLFHGGMRSSSKFTQSSALSSSKQEPSDACPDGSIELTEDGIKNIKESFINSALLCEKAGADGIEIHGAHGYLLSQFIDSHWNKREDKWGGPVENRARIILDIVHEIRNKTNKDFIIGLRLSLDNFGVLKGTTWQEAAWITNKLKDSLDYIHASLSDIRKKTETGEVLLECFQKAIHPSIPLMVAGGITTLKDLEWLEEKKVTMAAVGRAAIAHQNWPSLIFEKNFIPQKAPYTIEYLRSQGISDLFLNYLKARPQFIQN